MLPSLYNLTTAMLELLDSEDVTESSIEKAFGDIQSKDLKICHFRADMKGEIEKFKAEEKRIAAKRKAMENLVDRLELYVQTSMERLEVDSIKAGTFNISLNNNPPAVEVIDESIVPARFFTIIPETKQLDKKRVAETLKKGESVNGCQLKTGKHVRIR